MHTDAEKICKSLKAIFLFTRELSEQFLKFIHSLLICRFWPKMFLLTFMVIRAELRVELVKRRT